MKTLIALSAMAATGWGFAAGGILGALTGLVVAVGVGSGLQMFLVGTTASDDPNQPPISSIQRVGGLISAIAGFIAAYYGGWRWGWLYALGGYLLGMGATLIMGLPTILRARRARR